MESVDVKEIWQVDAGGEIYEAEFGELAQWIFEDALLPQDKVRRGNLRWIEARKVPILSGYFKDRENGAAPPDFSALKAANEIAGEHEQLSATSERSFAGSPVDRLIAEGNENRLANDNVSAAKSPGAKNVFASSDSALKINKNSEQSRFCGVHADSAAEYVCTTCESAFCRECPTSYGGSVKICPFCGAMCQTIKKIAEQKNKQIKIAAEAENFGLNDFVRACAHPFKFKASLIFGALMFVFFSIGQSAAALGGMIFVFAALFCVLASNMLTFGILANTVGNFSQGKLESNFMPDFDDFSLWDDVVHPFFLSIGVYLSSFGPFILVLIIGAYLVFSSMTSQANAVQKELTKIPGTDYYDNQKTHQQSEEVRRLLESVRQETESNIIRHKAAESQIKFSSDGSEEAEFAELNAMIEESRRAQLESVAGTSPEVQARQFNQMFRNFLNLAAPLVVIGFLALLWGIFYFPAACAVAGYTRSFFAVLNLSIGFDTIKRLGGDYLKILLMYVAVGFLIGGASVLLNVIFAAFDLPAIGNLPVKIFGSAVTFYFSIVFSCVLGYALFKNSGKLKLSR